MCWSAFQNTYAAYLQRQKWMFLQWQGQMVKQTTKICYTACPLPTWPIKTQGNYNNEIGLPYTVLYMPEGDGQNGPLKWGKTREISISLSNWRIQSCYCHLDWGSPFGILQRSKWDAKGKLQIADGMPEGGLLVVPADWSSMPTFLKILANSRPLWSRRGVICHWVNRAKG